MFLFILDRVIAVYEKLIWLVFILSGTALIIYFTVSLLQEKVSKNPLKRVLNGSALHGNGCTELMFQEQNEYCKTI